MVTPTHRNTERSPSDRGAALMLSLVLVMVVSVILGALVSVVLANFETSKVSHERTRQRYAADAAAEQAIESLRNDRTLCDPPTSTHALASTTVNGIPVEVTCRAADGLAPGAGGWAIVTTATGQPGITRSGSGPLLVSGPVFSARLDDAAAITVNGGDALEHRSASSCSSDANAPANLVVGPAPPYRYRCTDDPIPDIDHSLPAARPDAAPAATTTNGCKVFYPGTYTSVPVLAAENRFVSGTYYFHDVGRFLITNAEVAGGERPDESRVNAGTSACDVVADGAPGTGVKWIFGGTSYLEVGANADVELYRRIGGAAAEGQQGISLQAVTSPAPVGMTVSGRGLANPVVLVTAGAANAQLTVHGTIYAPGSFIDYAASTSAAAQLRGGMVVGRIRFTLPSDGAGMAVST